MPAMTRQPSPGILDNEEFKAYDTQASKRFHKVNAKQKNIVRKFAFATRMGTNQTHNDNFVLIPNLQQKSALHFFAICEGHGINGT